MKKYLVSITAIISLAVIEVFALIYGVNGTMRAVIFAMIAGLAGLSMPQPKFLKENGTR